MLARRVQRHDVRVLELRGDLDLPAESLAIHAGRELGRKNFDDDVPAERTIDRRRRRGSCRRPSAHYRADSGPRAFCNWSANSVIRV